jgi:putative phosphoribosyl transferase
MIPGRKSKQDGMESEVSIEADNALLQGTLHVPEGCSGIVLFAHGSGSSRRSPRNRYVAQVLQSHGIATLLFDLLTREEESVDAFTGELRFNIPLLAKRLLDATRWVMRRPDLQDLRIGYFGASTGAGAALVAAARLPDVVCAIVSRGGRPDLAAEALRNVEAPTLLIVGGDDEPVIGMNRTALAKLKCPEKELVLVPGATHLFEEPGTLEEVARIAADWFVRYLPAADRSHVSASSER